MVVTSTTPDGPLSAAGVVRGDVIVRIGSVWLPNKEDPSLDLMRVVEAEVSAGVEPIELGLWHTGALTTVSLKHGLDPLEVGLPGPSERLEAMLDAGLAHLVTLQESDGSFPGTGGNDSQVVTSSLAGLALIAGGAREVNGLHAAALSRCTARIAAAVGDRDTQLGPWAAAWATMFLAEEAGPLELQAGAFMTTSVVQGGLPAGGVFEMPEGLPEGMVMFEAGGDFELPDAIREMMENAGLEGESMQIMIGTPPAGFSGLPDAPVVPVGEAVDGPLWTAEQIEQLAGGDILERIHVLTQAVERLVALQRESGGWDTEVASFSDETLATNQALLALGMAERAGAPVPGEVLRGGLAFLREHTNGGHVFTVDAPGFDRRREAGRSNGAAAALNALNCRAGDPFLRELTDYGDRHGNTIPSGGSVPLHVLNTAILRRQRGLESWAVFFEEFRHLIVSLHESDGSFASYPEPRGVVSGMDVLCASEAGRTALWSFVIGLQSGRVPVTTATARNPLQTSMDSEGLRQAGGFRLPEGAKIEMGDDALQRLLEAAGGHSGQVIFKTVEDD